MWVQLSEYVAPIVTVSTVNYSSIVKYIMCVEGQPERNVWVYVGLTQPQMHHSSLHDVFISAQGVDLENAHEPQCSSCRAADYEAT